MEEMIRHLVATLKELEANYVIIGGIASSLWGKPRMTVDADVVVSVTDEALPDLLKRFKEKGFLISKSSEPKMAARLKRLLPVKVRYTKILSCDLRIASYTIDRLAIDRAKKVKIFNIEVPVATPEDVIIYKLVRFEDLDKADIKAIIQRLGKKLKVAYLKQAVMKLSEEVSDKIILDNFREMLRWFKK